MGRNPNGQSYVSCGKNEPHRETLMHAAAIELIERAQRARRQERLADARRDLVEAVSLARGGGERATLARALEALGQIERDLRQDESARPLYEEAVGIRRDEGDPLALAHSIRHLGDLHRRAGRLDEAERLYHEALGLYRGQGDPPRLDLANAVRPLALVKDAKGEVDEATRLWEEARTLYESVNVREGVAECAARLARAR